MKDSLQDQKIVIVGGSQGIGLATAQAAAQAGARVVITGRDADKLRRAATEIGDAASSEAFDASSPDALRDFFGRVGGFDHLVLAASGAAGGGPFRALAPEELRRGFDGKFWVQVLAAQAALPTLRADGSLTFLSAISARAANPGTAGLAAINGALEAMVPPLAVELKPLRVNAVSPGVVETTWWDRVPAEQRRTLFDQAAAGAPVGRVGRPEEVAAAILFLMTNGFMTGTIIECDGGLRLKASS